MTLEVSLIKLNKSLEQLEQSLDNLLWAVVQAQPEEEPGHALADHYDAAANDLLGLVRDARNKTEAVGQTAVDQLNLVKTRQALTTSQTCFNQLLSRFYDDLVAFEWIEALNALAQERGGAWAQWVEGVKDALGQCPPLLLHVGQALLPCWQNLVEQVTPLSISVQTIHTGQMATPLEQRQMSSQE